MGLARYSGTRFDYADNLEPRKSDLRDWAIAWTEQIAIAANGMDVGGHQQVFAMLHEIRRRVLKGDYGPPLKERIAPSQFEMQIEVDSADSA